jgi:putative oxidoreductase
MAPRSSHPLLSCTDGLAADWADFVQLVGRILLGQLFILIGWTKLTGYAFYVTYFTALKVPYADIWPWPIGILELVIGVSLLVGFATRYAALASLVFVVIATALAHRYWEYPEAQQFGQYNNFVKNLAVMAGSLYIFLMGGGRFAIDASLAKRR